MLYLHHVRASIKDAGKKCFGILSIDDSGLATDLLNVDSRLYKD